MKNFKKLISNVVHILPRHKHRRIRYNRTQTTRYSFKDKVAATTIESLHSPGRHNRKTQDSFKKEELTMTIVVCKLRAAGKIHRKKIFITNLFTLWDNTRRTMPNGHQILFFIVIFTMDYTINRRMKLLPLQTLRILLRLISNSNTHPSIVFPLRQFIS